MRFEHTLTAFPERKCPTILQQNLLSVMMEENFDDFAENRYFQNVKLLSFFSDPELLVCKDEVKSELSDLSEK